MRRKPDFLLPMHGEREVLEIYGWNPPKPEKKMPSEPTMTEQIKAYEIRPGDLIDGKKVVYAIPNYLREGRVEVRFEDHSTDFFWNGQTIAVARP